MGRISRRRLFELSLVALAVGCGGVGYLRVAKERASSELTPVQEKLRHFSQIYKGDPDFFPKKHEELQALSQEVNSLSLSLFQQIKDMQLDAEKYQRLLQQKHKIRADIEAEMHRSLISKHQSVNEELAPPRNDVNGLKHQRVSDDELAPPQNNANGFASDERKELIAQMEAISKLLIVKEELQGKLRSLSEVNENKDPGNS